MDLSTLIAAGAGNPLLLFAAALTLGGLHGLEPGHGKTMMAAYIVAVRGTVGQAVLLGLSAAFSHTVIVWVLAVAGLLYGDRLIGDRTEPWFVMGSGALVVAVAMWVFWTSRPASRRRRHEHRHAPQDRSHEGARGEAHGHLDAHARSHVRELERRVGSGRTTTAQTVAFGLSGGLIPCPAAITVLLLCLQLGHFALGIVLVSAFSAGLAAMLVAVGAAAALGLGFASGRSRRVEAAMANAPRISAAVICLIGAAMMASGWSHLHGAGP